MGRAPSPFSPAHLSHPARRAAGSYSHNPLWDTSARPGLTGLAPCAPTFPSVCLSSGERPLSPDHFRDNPNICIFSSPSLVIIAAKKQGSSGWCVAVKLNGHNCRSRRDSVYFTNSVFYVHSLHLLLICHF